MNRNNLHQMASSLFNKALNQGSVVPGKENETTIYKQITVGNLFVLQIRYIAEDSLANSLVIYDIGSKSQVSLYIDPEQWDHLSTEAREYIAYVYGIVF